MEGILLGQILHLIAITNRPNKAEQIEGKIPTLVGSTLSGFVPDPFEPLDVTLLGGPMILLLPGGRRFYLGCLFGDFLLGNHLYRVGFIGGKDLSFFCVKHLPESIQARPQSLDLRRVKVNRPSKVVRCQVSGMAKLKHMFQGRAYQVAIGSVGRREIDGIKTLVGVDDPTQGGRRHENPLRVGKVALILGGLGRTTRLGRKVMRFFV